MNLKEAFRVQSQFSSLMQEAYRYLANSNYALKVTKTHLLHSVNPEVEDKVEEVDFGQFHAPDDVVAFMVYLIREKERLCRAISRAKEECKIDIDASVESNKLRQQLRNSLTVLLRNVSRKTTERGTAYRFDIENKQTPYGYTIDTDYAENYNKENAKALSKQIIMEADAISNRIDEAMINSEVDYCPFCDVNDGLDDAIEAFLKLDK
jgi:hypothetical protein